MHIGKARHLKICEVFGKKKNEDSSGLRRRDRGRNYVHKPKIYYIEANTQKGNEIGVFSTGLHTPTPNAQNGAHGANRP